MRKVDIKLFLVTFASVFLAELGDKTQLATVLFASRSPAGALSVFVGAASALVLSTAVAVAAGAMFSTAVDGRYVTLAAGVGFVAIGLWTIRQAVA